MEVWLTMAVTQERHSFGQKCGMMAKGGRWLKVPGSEAGGRECPEERRDEGSGSNNKMDLGA